LTQSRKRAKSRNEADERLFMRIGEIKQDHPLWGYRRIWAYMRYRQKQVLGKNRVYRVMKENRLLVTKNMKIKAKRTPMRPKPVATRINQYWGMDMTKILFPDGWGYLHVIKDWYSKEIVGWQFSKMSRTEDWLEALNFAINSRYPRGIRETTVLPKLITDNGCQPTSEKFMSSCSILDIK
jgi:putative transposase